MKYVEINSGLLHCANLIELLELAMWTPDKVGLTFENLKLHKRLHLFQSSTPHLVLESLDDVGKLGGILTKNVVDFVC